MVLCILKFHKFS